MDRTRAERLVSEALRAPSGASWRSMRATLVRRTLHRWAEQPILFLAIGKTGSNSVGELLARLDPATADRLGVRRAPLKLHHIESRVPDLGTWLRGAELTFVFRDPALRYASGFRSRLRQGLSPGRARLHRWSAEEAAAFHWFVTPNDLFEALGSTDERLRSAADFTMHSIGHLRQDHAWYLGDVERFRRDRARYRFFCPIDELGTHIDRFFDLAPGADRQALRDLLPHEHRDPDPTREFSDLAIANLRAHRPEEFTLHERLLDEWERLR